MDHSIKLDLGSELDASFKDRSSNASAGAGKSHGKTKAGRKGREKKKKKNKALYFTGLSNSNFPVFFVFLVALFVISIFLRAYVYSMPLLSQDIQKSIGDSIKSRLVEEYSSEQYSMLSPQQKSAIVYQKYHEIINSPNTKIFVKKSIERAKAEYRDVNNNNYFYTPSTFNYYSYAKDRNFSSAVAFFDYAFYSAMGMFSNKTLSYATSYVSLFFFFLTSIAVYLLASRISPFAGLVSGLAFSLHPFIIKNSLVGISDEIMVSLFFISLLAYSLVSFISIFDNYKAEGKKAEGKAYVLHLPKLFKINRFRILAHAFLVFLSLVALKRISVEFYFAALASFILSFFLFLVLLWRKSTGINFKSRNTVAVYLAIAALGVFAFRISGRYFGYYTGLPALGGFVMESGTYFVLFAVIGFFLLLYKHKLPLSYPVLFSGFGSIALFSSQDAFMAIASFIFVLMFGISIFYFLGFLYKKTEALDIKSKELRAAAFFGFVAIILVPYGSSFMSRFHDISMLLPAVDDISYNFALDIGIMAPRAAVITWNNSYLYSAVSGNTVYSADDSNSSREMIAKFFAAHNLTEASMFLEKIDPKLKYMQKVIVVDSSLLEEFGKILFYANNMDIFGDYKNINTYSCFRAGNSADIIKCKTPVFFYLNLSSNFTNSDLDEIVLINISNVSADNLSDNSGSVSNKTLQNKTENNSAYSSYSSYPYPDYPHIIHIRNNHGTGLAGLIYASGSSYYISIVEKSYLDSMLVKMLFFRDSLNSIKLISHYRQGKRAMYAYLLGMQQN